VDIATIIGLVLGALVVVGAVILGGSPGMFIEPVSVVVVIVGTVAAVFTSFPLKRILGVVPVVLKALEEKTPDLQELIAQLVGFAEIARRDGILSLENHMEDMNDPFIVQGIQMAVDGTDPELIEQIMEADLENLMDRHAASKKILDAAGRFAPAFGMIGTLIGLVSMLGNMEDPSGIGAGMAVALLTTLYGAIMANVFFLPLADKLGLKSEEEVLVKSVIIRGVMSIQAGDNPRVVEQKLRTFIAPRYRSSGDDDMAAAA
jgi:chemotaxis protein MotA